MPIKESTPDHESIASYYKRNPFAQEQHHAMHALTFFFFMSWKTLRGERITRRLLGRIIHHLMDLREFLEDTDLNRLANSLRVSVQREYDESLGLVTRCAHKVFRRLGRDLVAIEWPVFSHLGSLLIALCDEEKKPKVCMYAWLIANQQTILDLAKHYGRDSVFEGLLPIAVPKASGGREKTEGKESGNVCSTFVGRQAKGKRGISKNDE